MSYETLIGRHRRKPVGQLADDAARKIAAAGKPLALTFDPDGRWWLEAPDTAAEVDMVGVYRGAQSFSLWQAIAADMKHEIANRGMQ